MSPISPFHALDASLHEFDPAHFGTIEDLRSLKPNDDGWSAVMVTCSEFGFQPDQNSLFEIGELYILQNFGNVILPAAGMDGITEVTDALETKGLKDVIVCGHLNCRTVGHFLWKERNSEWLEHGDKLRDFMDAHYPDLDKQTRLNIAAQENVLLQLEKELASLTQAGVSARLYGWMTEAISNHVYHFDPATGQFVG